MGVLAEALKETKIKSAASASRAAFCTLQSGAEIACASSIAFLFRCRGCRLHETAEPDADPNHPSDDRQPPEASQDAERDLVAMTADVLKLSTEVIRTEELCGVLQTDHGRVAR